MLEKKLWEFVPVKYVIFSAAFTFGSIIFEYFLFSGYYADLKIGRFLHDGIFVKPLKIAALGIPSYILSGFFVLAALISPFT